MAPCHLAKQNDPAIHYSLCQQEANSAPILPQSASRHDAERQNLHSNSTRTPYAAAPYGSVAKIACKDLENAARATLAHFGSVFSLILGLVRRRSGPEIEPIIAKMTF